MSYSDYRAKAREILKGRWKVVLAVTFVAALLGGMVASATFNIDLNLDEDHLQLMPQNVRDFFLRYLVFAGGVGGTLNLVHFILGGTVRLGYCKYLLKLHDGEEGEMNDLFSEFERFGDGFLLSLLTGIYVFLWTLLFIIPGIIASYRYAMAPFIMEENPGMKPSEAINASKEMMDGHKAELFTLNLTFIGWHLLNGLTLGIGSLWLNPYLNVTKAVFYRDLSSKQIVVGQTEVLPEETPEEIAEESPEIPTEE